MQYRNIRNNPDSISALSFGCMRLPEKNNKIDEKKASELIYKAIDYGINYFDTAYPYHMGESEPFLGNVLYNGLRKKVMIATKLPPFTIGKSSDMESVLSNQLKRLKTDYIDYYMLHGIDEKTWEKLYDFGVLEFLDRAKQNGKIRNAGFSYHGFIKKFKEITDIYNWNFCQIQYNYLDENNQAGKEGLLYASDKGLGVFIMEPLRGGALAIKQPDEISNIFNESPVKRTPADWALRWVLDHKQVTSVLSGMNSIGQLEENIKIAETSMSGSMSENEIAIIDKVKKEYFRIMKIGCTACQYCMPCPAKVNIPVCFDIYNRKKVFKEKNFDVIVKYTLHLGGLDRDKNKREFASQCTGCGKCEKKCPQHLPIRSLLKEVSKEFETIFFRVLMIYGKFFYNGMKKK